MSTIYFYNTLTKQKEVFKSITTDTVSMYNCGPTVYSKPHIGNMCSYIFADTIARALTYNNFKVNQVINITDVGHLTDDGDDGDDKMETSAQKTGTTAQEIANTYTKIFYTCLDALNINRSAITFTKATDHIPEQIAMIEKLEKKGHVYVISDGVYFDTATFPHYGKLGNTHTNDESQNQRISENTEKRQQSDFAVWKFSKPEETRQQEWDSPWGVGFPGWHIECSAMSQKYLGDTFDIHTGGIDHIPTHHNNEIAQSESVTGKPQANYWMHNNHVLIDGKKISKSLGNTIYFEDLEEKNISPLAYRYWILTADYKTLVNFTWDAVTAADKAFKKLITQLANFDTTTTGSIHEIYKEKFIAAINDDLNTATGIAIIWELLKDDEVSAADKQATIYDFDKVLGLNIEALVAFANQLKNTMTNIPDEVTELGRKRDEARKNKDFGTADMLRDEARKLGFDIHDTEKGIVYSIIE